MLFEMEDRTGSREWSSYVCVPLFAYITLLRMRIITDDHSLSLGLYVIVGVMFWYYPGSDPAELLASCT